MAGSHIDQACAFCASSDVQPLRRTGINGELTEYRCRTCGRTWAEVLDHVSSARELPAPVSASVSPAPSSSPPIVAGPAANVSR